MGRCWWWWWWWQGGHKARQGFLRTSSQPRLLEPPSQEEAASQRGNPEKRDRFVKTGRSQIILSFYAVTSYKSAIWSRYFAWILILDEHMAQGASPGGHINSWFTGRGECIFNWFGDQMLPMMLWLSMPILVNSWINRSVSYKLRWIIIWVTK